MMKPLTVDAVFWKSFHGDHSVFVSGESQRELYNYLVCGLPAGSFHTAIFAGDLMGAAERTNPLNTWSGITAMCKWIINTAPEQSWGSYENVQSWLALSKEERVRILEKKGLLTPEKEVAWNIISTTPH